MTHGFFLILELANRRVPSESKAIIGVPMMFQGRTQMWEVFCGGELVSQSQIPLHFFLVPFSFRFLVEKEIATSLVRVVALDGAARGLVSNRLIVSLGIVVFYKNLRVAENSHLRASSSLL